MLENLERINGLTLLWPTFTAMAGGLFGWIFRDRISSRNNKLITRASSFKDMNSLRAVYGDVIEAEKIYLQIIYTQDIAKKLLPNRRVKFYINQLFAVILLIFLTLFSCGMVLIGAGAGEVKFNDINYMNSIFLIGFIFLGAFILFSLICLNEGAKQSQKELEQYKFVIDTLGGSGLNTPTHDSSIRVVDSLRDTVINRLQSEKNPRTSMLEDLSSGYRFSRSLFAAVPVICISPTLWWSSLGLHSLLSGIPAVIWLILQGIISYLFFTCLYKRFLIFASLGTGVEDKVKENLGDVKINLFAVRGHFINH